MTIKDRFYFNEDLTDLPRKPKYRWSEKKEIDGIDGDIWIDDATGEKYWFQNIFQSKPQ